MQTPAAPKDQHSRFTEMDGLRGLCTGIVVAAHISFPPLFWAWNLMDMFFIMSSFLLTRIALKQFQSGRGIIAFYKRRIERIWPLYFLIVWIVFLLMLALNFTTGAQQHDVSAFWRYFSFSQYSEYNFKTNIDFNYVPQLHHLWSLAIEEQFYILLPLFIAVLRKSHRLVVLIIVVGVSAIGITQRFEHSNMLALSNHLDAFALGGLLAAATPLIAIHSRRATIVASGMLACGAIGFLPYFINGYLLYFSHQTVIGYSPAPATAMIVFWGGAMIYLTVHRGANHLSVMRWPPLVYMGRISYALYLVHYPIFRLLPEIMQTLSGKTGLPVPGKLITTIIGLMLAFAAAHALYRWIDQKLQSGEPIRSPPKDKNYAQATT